MNHIDVVIIGSGFGGSVMALRLAEAGHQVVVLERGREWRPSTQQPGPGDRWLPYPRQPSDAWWFDANDAARKNGWLELRRYKDMLVAQGAGVGGGSLVYANVSVKAPADVLDGWEVPFGSGDLEPYYQRVADMLELERLPDGQETERFKLMEEAATAVGFGERLTRVELAVRFHPQFDPQSEDSENPTHFTSDRNKFGVRQGTCVHCGDCDVGCDVLAKNTLDLNYLAAARTHGAEIRPLHVARRITPEGDGFRVDFDQIRVAGGANEGVLEPGTIRARHVVVAAGTMNTNELLLRCRDEFKTLPGLSERLGKGWSANGDFLTPAFYPDRRPRPTQGPTITAAIDFLDGGGSQTGERYWIEDGGFPNLLANWVADRGATPADRGLRRLTKALRRGPVDQIMVWFAQGIDASDGEMRLERDADGTVQFKLHWRLKRSKRMFKDILRMHKRLSRKTRGIPITLWSWFGINDLATPHPLGGCAMAKDAATGVVDHRGAVFGVPNLWVMDGSVLPSAIGQNPSRTIAALAERAAEHFPNP